MVCASESPLLNRWARCKTLTEDRCRAVENDVWSNRDKRGKEKTWWHAKEAVPVSVAHANKEWASAALPIDADQRPAYGTSAYIGIWGTGWGPRGASVGRGRRLPVGRGKKKKSREKRIRQSPHFIAPARLVAALALQGM